MAKSKYIDIDKYKMQQIYWWIKSYAFQLNYKCKSQFCFSENAGTWRASHNIKYICI